MFAEAAVEARAWMRTAASRITGSGSADASSGRRQRQSHSRVLADVLNLEDFERVGTARLPHSVLGYVSGGSEGGEACANNRQAFRQWGLVTRVLRDVSGRRQDVRIFGTSYAAPFAIAPMGAAAVVGYDADNRMARAARAARIPFVLSANSITPLEELATQYPGAWFAAYQQPDERNIRDMCTRIERSGLSAFMLTVDVPVGSNRENNIRSGYTMPFRVTPRLAFDAATHPRWLATTALRTLAKRGVPAISNIDPHDRPTIFSRRLGGVTGHASFSWKQAEIIRRHWSGPFVLKGVLSPDDARIARELGADGIVVSNHGGRQLDAAVSPIEVLQDVKAQSGEMTVFADSGFRRGNDVLKALAMGADCILIGRPFLFAAALAGEAGVAHAIRLLMHEIGIDMALLGLEDLSMAKPEMLVPRGWRA